MGITSRAAYPLTNNCGDGGIYARADPIIDWAEDVTGLAVTRPDCENVGEPANRPPEPTADDMRLPAGDTAISQVWANDPDSAQAHVYEVVSGPAFGTATIDGAGSASFRAPPESEGSTSFFVRVTDDGEPPLFADLEIRVEVEPAPVEQDTGEPVNPGDSAEPSEVTLQAGGCSCSQGLAHPAGMALFAVPFAAIRRRSRLRGR